MKSNPIHDHYSQSAEASPGLLSSVPFFERQTGWWLLLIIPLSAVFVYLLHTQTVDLEWLYFHGLPKRFGDKANLELAKQLTTHEPLWHFAKQGLWPTIILTLDMLFVGIGTMVLGQLFGVAGKLRHFFVLGLWSKATYLLTAAMIAVRILLLDTPTHIFTKDLDLFSWNSLLGLQGDRPLQFFTCNHGPIAFLGVTILAYGFRQLSGRSWLQSITFAVLPYGFALSFQYLVFGVIF